MQDGWRREMPTLNRISAEIGGHMVEAGAHVASSPTDQRVFVVGAEAHRLLKRAGIRVPPPGQTYNVAQLNQTLEAGGLTPEERIHVKFTLLSCGLLRQGK
jgi:hypothetical protein